MTDRMTDLGDERLSRAIEAMKGRPPEVEYDEDGSYTVRFWGSPTVAWDFSPAGSVMVTCVDDDPRQSFSVNLTTGSTHPPRRSA